MVGADALASEQHPPMQPGDFSLYRADHFDIYYDSTRITDVGDVVIAADAAYADVTAFFGPYDYRTRIVLAANHLQYTDLLRVDSLPESNRAGSWGDGDSGTVVIEISDQVPGFGAVLTHEFARIAMRTKLIGNKYALPEWFAEGLASYVANDIPDRSRDAINRSCRDDKLMSVPQMEGLLEGTSDPNTNENDLSLARAQSGMLVSHIGQKYGDDYIRFILKDFGTTGDIDKAFTSRIGYTPEDVNTVWKVDLLRELVALDRQATAQRISGYVLDPTGKPVAGQTIAFTALRNDTAVFGKTYTTRTDGAGYYVLNMTYGPFKIYQERAGYAIVGDNITLQKNEVKLYNITLAEAGSATPEATVSPAAPDRGAIYAVLGVVNAAAILLIALVVLRTRK